MSKFRSDLVCNQNQLKTAVLENVTSAFPTNPVRGQIIYKTDGIDGDNIGIYIYDGESWLWILPYIEVGSGVLGNSQYSGNNFDYNVATSFSVYSIQTSGGTASNYPAGYQDAAGVLIVLDSLYYLEQRVTYFADGSPTFVRTKRKSDNTWKPWVRQVHQGDNADLGTVVVGDHGTASTDQVVNVCYGTGDPPTASTTTEGTIFLKYTA